MHNEINLKNTWKPYDIDVPDCIINIKRLSIRAINSLLRANITTISALMEMTDDNLLKVRNIGKKSLMEINAAVPGRTRAYEGEAADIIAQRAKNELSDTARKIIRKPYYIDEPDSLLNIEGLSIWTINALLRAGITTISALMATTDYNLLKVRNLGEKCLMEINAAVPGRIRTYDGEAADIEAQRVKKKLYDTARRIMRFMVYWNMKLSELMSSKCGVTGKRRARQILTDYCTAFPERIGDVLSHFEAMNDTSDKFYKTLKYKISSTCEAQ